MKYSYESNVKQVVLVALAITLATIFTSCKKAAEKTSEEIIERSIGNDAKVDIDKDKLTIQTEEGTFTTDVSNKSWPGEISREVPEFKYGEVISTTTQKMDEGEKWAIIFENIADNALQNYKKDLESKGFKINYTTIAGRGGHLAAEKGQLRVAIMTGNGNATVTISTDK